MLERHSTAEARRQSLLLTLCALFVGFFVTAELLGAKLFRFTLFGLDTFGYKDQVVLPIAVRIAGFFDRVNTLWPPYLLRDTMRIAQHQGIEMDRHGVTLE